MIRHLPTKRKRRRPLPAAVRLKVWNDWLGVECRRGPCQVCLREPISLANFHVAHIVSDAAGGAPTCCAGWRAGALTLATSTSDTWLKKPPKRAKNKRAKRKRMNCRKRLSRFRVGWVCRRTVCLVFRHATSLTKNPWLLEHHVFENSTRTKRAALERNFQVNVCSSWPTRIVSEKEMPLGLWM